MKAIRVEQFGPPDVLKIQDVPNLQPGPGQVVVRVKAAGINPVDTYIRSGNYARKPTLPYTPGLDGAGTIEALGTGVSHFKVGDRVYLSGALSGTYAEQALCDAQQIHALPERLSFAQGAAIHVAYATAYVALMQRANARLGETVLIHGASGGVGTAAVQVAKAAGLKVIGTAGSPKGLELLRQQGVIAFDHGDANYLTRIFDELGGVDIVIEMLANVNLGKDLKVLKRGGRVIVVGNRGTVEVDPRDLMGRDASIHGMVLLNMTMSEVQSVHQKLAAGFSDGQLVPVVGCEFPLAEAPQAHQAVMESGARGKIVLLT